MTPLERQRLAACAVWRLDADSRDAGAWSDLGGLQLHATGLPLVFWNGAHLMLREGLAHLPAAAAWFRGRNLPWGLLIPAELDVEPPGGSWVTDQPVMLRDLSDLPPVSDVPMRWDAPGDAAAVQAVGFDTPPDLARDFVLPKTRGAACSLVVAYAGDVPAATATLVRVDGVAAVFGVATLPENRRRGLGRAVTLAVLHAAAEEGCDLAYLNPSPMAHGVYSALGFADAPPWRVWSVADPLAHGEVGPEADREDGPPEELRQGSRPGR